MSKIRVLSDQLANQIAAGEVVERPASVAKELVENSIDAGARRIVVDVEAGGRKLLRVADDGEGMTRDDALLAFERHATSKIASAEDLSQIATLGFRGEALASIASVARVELLTKTAHDAAATRVLMEGGRLRDVKDAAHPQGTTIAVRDLFFNVPARRKFLRSEATESFHLANLVTHYALAHPEIAFTLTNNGRETLRVAPARDLRERAYQLFGPEFLDNLLEVRGGHARIALVRGFISAPRERRTSRDAQYLFINGRYVRDRVISRALSDGYRTILPQGVYPAVLLFLDVPLEEVDVNVHPAKTEVRFRRAPAVGDAVREAVRETLSRGGYGARPALEADEQIGPGIDEAQFERAEEKEPAPRPANKVSLPDESLRAAPARELQGRMKFDVAAMEERDSSPVSLTPPLSNSGAEVETQMPVVDEPRAEAVRAVDERHAVEPYVGPAIGPASEADLELQQQPVDAAQSRTAHAGGLRHLSSVDSIVREVAAESFGASIRPLGQLAGGYILASDEEGLLLIDQRAAHERILFDRYRAQEAARSAESQHLLMPETFDLTPAQAAVFDQVVGELESYGFGMMRLSGRTVAIRSVPADLPAGEARSMLSEILNTLDAGRRTEARAVLREQIALALASRAAIKLRVTLAREKMSWLIESLLKTSSPTTCPHGGPTVLRLSARDIEKNFHHS